MNVPSFPRPRNDIRAIVAALLVAAILAFFGCSNNDNKNPVAPGGGTPTTTLFTGFVTDGVQSGKVIVVVNSPGLAPRLRAGSLHQALVSATGTVKIGSATTNLTGYYGNNDLTGVDSLWLDGGGWSLRGGYGADGGQSGIIGAASGPNGPGFFVTGNFDGLPISVYTGKYFNQAMTDSGTWNMATYADTVFIVAYTQGRDPILLDGELNGAAPLRGLDAFGGADDSSYDIRATGTLNTTTGAVGGTWIYTAKLPIAGTSDNGDWNGALVP